MFLSGPRHKAGAGYVERRFDRVEAEEMGEGTHERYHELAHSWGG